ncbi:MAG: GNAT family N-acetyltransferase [Atopobiaceae bacterium]|nr:GNAT family N-acetyltransferase [Atopobiaceae bacterium]
MMWPEPIVTERLTLRPWRKDDADALFAAASDPAVGTPAGFPPHKTHEHSEEVLRDVLMKPEVYAICIRASEMPDTPVGAIGLMFEDEDFSIAEGEAELGYWIAKPYWNAGYMTEAVQALERHAFMDLGLSALWAASYSENPASAAVQKKAHLTFHHHQEGSRDLMGKTHGLEVSRITRTEWERAIVADPTGKDYRGKQQAEASRVMAEMPLISQVRSGGQTGADRGGLDAAREAGVAICGWCPPGGLAEDFPEAPGLMKLYPELREGHAPGYVERTAWNVRDAHATLIVSPGGLEPLSGTEMTKIFAERFGRPVLVLEGDNIEDDAATALGWLRGLDMLGLTLNVAGPRESKMPGTYLKTKDIVAALLATQRSDSTI